MGLSAEGKLALGRLFSSRQDILLEWVLKEFGEPYLSEMPPDNNNFPPELQAINDPATYEFDDRDTSNAVDDLPLFKASRQRALEFTFAFCDDPDEEQEGVM